MRIVIVMWHETTRTIAEIPVHVTPTDTEGQIAFKVKAARADASKMLGVPASEMPITGIKKVKE